jgi:hypothetical protein
VDERIKERKENPMESTRFDAISRVLAGMSSRRNAMRTIAAGGLGLSLGATGLELEDALARKHRRHRKKKNKKGTDTKVVRQTCQKTYQCQGDLVCQVANSENGCGQEVGKHCCVPLGGPCDDGCDCCGVGVICNGGYCDAT